MTVLVVDDDAAAREYVRDVLEKAGYSVREAADGQTALQAVQKAMPACIVLDLVMPGLSGFDTLRALRKEHPDLAPVVVLTSMEGGGTRTYATRVNKADAFVTKGQLDDRQTGLLSQVRRLTAVS
jgi:CheY-like chemotaxis protein